jgi:hypothetical protein
MYSVHLFFLIDRDTLKVDRAAIWSDGTPCIDQSRYIPVKWTSWDGKTHQEAHDRATNYLRTHGNSAIGEALTKMVLGG